MLVRSFNVYSKENYIIKKLILFFLTLCLIITTLLSPLSSMKVMAMDFTYVDNASNPVFVYNKTTKTISATVSISGAGSLGTMHRYCLFFLDPTNIGSGKAYTISRPYIYRQGTRCESDNNIDRSIVDMYIFALDANTKTNGTYTMHSFAAGTTTDNYNHTGSIAGNLDLLGSGKTIDDLWQLKDWIIIIGPNWTNTSWNCINVYSLDCVLGTVSQTFHVDPISGPSNVHATSPDCQTLDVAWSEVENAKSYQIDVATDSNFSNIISGYNSKSITTASCQITGLSGNTNYYIRVRSIDSDNTVSPNSSVLTAKTNNHSYVSNINDNVLESTCSICNAHAELSLQADSPTYSEEGYSIGWKVGQPVSFSLDGSTDWKNTFNVSNPPAIYYEGIGETEYVKTTVKPTNEGTYRASVSQGHATLYTDFILKRFYTISFSSNGGKGTMPQIERTKGSYDLPFCSMRPPLNMEFDGWATSPTEKRISTKTIYISSNVTLYAIWKKHNHMYHEVQINPGIKLKKCNCGAYLIIYN